MTSTIPPKSSPRKEDTENLKGSGNSPEEIEKGETPEEAIRREIREELEVEIEVGPLLGTIEYDYPNFHLSMDTFLAKVRKVPLFSKKRKLQNG